MSSSFLTPAVSISKAALIAEMKKATPQPDAFLALPDIAKVGFGKGQNFKVESKVNFPQFKRKWIQMRTIFKLFEIPGAAHVTGLVTLLVTPEPVPEELADVEPEGDCYGGEEDDDPNETVHVFHGFVRRGRFFTKSLYELTLSGSEGMHIMTKGPARSNPNLLCQLKGETLDKMLDSIPPEIRFRFVNFGMNEISYFEARSEGACRRTEKILECDELDLLSRDYHTGGSEVMFGETVAKVDKYEGEISEAQTMGVYWFKSSWIELHHLFVSTNEGEVTQHETMRTRCGCGCWDEDIEWDGEGDEEME